MIGTVEKERYIKIEQEGKKQQEGNKQKRRGGFFLGDHFFGFILDVVL